RDLLADGGDAVDGVAADGDAADVEREQIAEGEIAGGGTGEVLDFVVAGEIDLARGRFDDQVVHFQRACAGFGDVAGSDEVERLAERDLLSHGDRAAASLADLHAGGL